MVNILNNFGANTIFCRYLIKFNQEELSTFFDSKTNLIYVLWRNPDLREIYCDYLTNTIEMLADGGRRPSFFHDQPKEMQFGEIYTRI